jgi:hypothetical protein
MAVLYVSQAVVPATNLFWPVLMLTYGAFWTSGGALGRGDKRCRITAQRTRDLAVSASSPEVHRCYTAQWIDQDFVCSGVVHCDGCKMRRHLHYGVAVHMHLSRTPRSWGINSNLNAVSCTEASGTNHECCMQHTMAKELSMVLTH